MSTSFTASGKFRVTWSAQLGSPTTCHNPSNDFQVQIHEEHGAYEGDAEIGTAGTLVRKAQADGVAWTCEYSFAAVLPETSSVYEFRLLQYGADHVEDSQKTTTSRLRQGTVPVLDGPVLNG